jgi:hypothetical protein
MSFLLSLSFDFTLLSPRVRPAPHRRHTMGRFTLPLALVLAVSACDSFRPDYELVGEYGIKFLEPDVGDVTVAGADTEIVVLVTDLDVADGVDVVFHSDVDGELCVVELEDDAVANCEATLSLGSHVLTVEAYDDDDLIADGYVRHDVVAAGGDLNDLDGDGYTVAEGDCDDSNPNTYPTALELVDGFDNDCDGYVDEGIDTFDDDGDGYAEAAGDCDDTNPARNPGAPELEDGIDNDCDGKIDEGTPAYDDDGDGFSEAAGDCFDNSAAVYPGAPELADGLDNDCDGVVDEGTVNFDDDGDGYSEALGDCNDDDRSISPVAAEVLDGIDNNCDGRIDEGTVAYDDDGDGFTEQAGDCNDALAFVYPGAVEVTDGVDNDCDGVIDELDGSYAGDVTVVVTGASVGVCTGELTLTVDGNAATPVFGTGTCQAGLFEGLTLQGTLSGSSVTGDADATVRGVATSTTWTGGFAADQLGGTFSGSATDGTSTYDYTAVFAVSR